MTDQSEQIATLRQENASLQAQLADAQRQIAELRQSRALLEALIEHSPSNISVIDLDKRLLLVNPASARDAGLSREQLVGKTQYELYGAEVVAEWDVSDQQVINQRQPLSVENVMPLADGDHHFLAMKFPLFDEQHNVYAIGTVTTDITPQKKVEQARLALQQEIIDAQRTALRELSTPLVPISEGVVAMPLVGEIDNQRAQLILETLLEGISERQATTAIIDITGVKVVDTQVAQALLRAAQAAGLLGSQVVLTGIGPEVAQSLVQLGTDLGRIVTRSDLQSGIAFALGAQSAGALSSAA
jgi:PAS domain S-box-containing protein